jgi:hypothetical protein
MAGTKAGSVQGVKTNLARDPEFYKKIGAKGGAVNHPETRYFRKYPEVAMVAGARGGKVSRRPGSVKSEVKIEPYVKPEPKRGFLKRFLGMKAA